jgi:hypothetical protein
LKPYRGIPSAPGLPPFDLVLFGSSPSSRPGS